MSDPVIQLMPIMDFDEDMLVALDRNFSEVARLLGLLQRYMNTEGKPLINLYDEFVQNSIIHGLEADLPAL